MGYHLILWKPNVALGRQSRSLAGGKDLPLDCESTSH